MLIDLGIYRTEGIKIFSGRPRGQALRTQLELDRLDEHPESHQINVPEDVISIHTSFFLGLFGKSVRKAGSGRAFLTKFQFTCDEDILEDVNEGIELALKESNALDRR